MGHWVTFSRSFKAKVVTGLDKSNEFRRYIVFEKIDPEPITGDSRPSFLMGNISSHRGVPPTKIDDRGPVHGGVDGDYI